MNSPATPAGDFDFRNSTHRKIALQFELRMLQLYGPTLGIYALPNLSDESIWNGIIFVRNGYYKDGKFKFTLHLHQFPLQQPRVFFSCKMHHPCVDAATGELDVASVLTDAWNYCSENMLYNLMKDMRRMFTDKHSLANMFSSNRTMAQLFQGNLHEFIVKALQSVSESIDQLHVNEATSSLKITEDCAESNRIKDMLGEVVRQKELSMQEKIEKFLSMIVS